MACNFLDDFIYFKKVGDVKHKRCKKGGSMKEKINIEKDDIIIVLLIIILFLIAIGFFKLFYSVPR